MLLQGMCFTFASFFYTSHSEKSTPNWLSPSSKTRSRLSRPFNFWEYKMCCKINSSRIRSYSAHLHVHIWRISLILLLQIYICTRQSILNTALVKGSGLICWLVLTSAHHAFLSVSYALYTRTPRVLPPHVVIIQLPALTASQRCISQSLLLNIHAIKCINITQVI